jgi:anti-anti-sigma factor
LDVDYLTVSVTDGNRQRLLTLSGELDLDSVRELEAGCRAPPTVNDLLLDLSKVEFIDVVGLRAIVALGSEENEVTLISPSRVVRRMIMLAGLRDTLSVSGESPESCDV